MVCWILLLVSGVLFSSFCTNAVGESYAHRDARGVRFAKRSSSLALVIPPPFKRLRDDCLALTRRATARHILLPTDSSALSLKQKIRNRASAAADDERRMYVEDAFAVAAYRHSLDEETAVRGGSFAESAPQGYCHRGSPELDRACFESPLGEVCGPIRTGRGWHLVLVTERTNCESLDGYKTKIVRGGKDNRDTVFVRSEDEPASLEANVGLAVMGLCFAFWISTAIVANLAATLSM